LARIHIEKGQPASANYSAAVVITNTEELNLLQLKRAAACEQKSKRLQ
jgi:hypothetical protein